MTDRHTVWRTAILVALGSLILFSFLGSARLWDRDEPRNARASQEMLARADWVVPTFNDELRAHKPILLYWMQMAAYLTLGQSEFTARLPSALAALTAILAIAWLASRLAGEKTIIGSQGFWTGAVLATCTLFVMAGRAATPDACLIAATTVGISALVGGIVIEPSGRSKLDKSIIKPSLSWSWFAVGYGALGVAILAKGPVGLVLPLMIVHTWWLLVERPTLDSTQLPRSRWVRIVARVWNVASFSQLGRSLLALRTLPGVVLALAVAAPWYVAVGLATDGEFLAEFLWRHNVGRAMSSMEGHDGGVLFYPLALLVGTFPWSLWLIPIVWWGIRAKRRGAAARTSMTLAGVWIAVTLALFTFASTKLPSYITSCYPGVAMVVGGFLKDFAAQVRMPSRGWRMLAGSVAITVAFCLASGLVWFSYVEALPLVGWVGCSSVLLAAAGLAGWIVDWNNRPQWTPAIWLTAACGLHVALFGVGTRAVDAYRTEVDMLIALDQRAGSAVRWFGVGGMEPSWVYYLNKPIGAIPEALSQPGNLPEQWLTEMQTQGIQTGDHLIVAGDTAERIELAISRWSSTSSPLLEVGRTERFLRPGNIVVYQFINPAGTLAARPDALPRR